MTCKKCKIKYEPEIYDEGEQAVIDFCPLHAAAGGLLEAAKLIDAEWRTNNRLTLETQNKLFCVIAKAEKSPA